MSYEEFSPQADRLIAKPYDVDSFGEGKTREQGSPVPPLRTPTSSESPMLIGMVTRLVGQKGLDLVKRVFDEILTYDNVKLVVLGDGDPEYVQFFKDMAVRHEHKMRIVVGYDNQPGASDLRRIRFVPDAFEIRTVRPRSADRAASTARSRWSARPGGLVDTVKPYNEFDKTGNGFSFAHYNAHDMMHVIRYALFGVIKTTSARLGIPWSSGP
ncbi:MAG: hypothetical protein MZU97_01540 [Bacillus subtilis]|nr:hypothetical protein [Bacillus subtilis]